MEFLLDTHTLLWWYTNQSKLSRATYKIIEDPYNDIYYSPLNLWEVVLKYQKGKLNLADRKPDEFLDMIEADEDFRYLELLPGSVATSYQLPQRHTDLFDRMLAWEAMQHDFILLSSDESLRLYEQDGLRIIS